MGYQVSIPRKVQKATDKLPPKERRVFVHLVLDIRRSDPFQPAYKNYSKPGKDRYHCHLSYHWIDCW